MSYKFLAAASLTVTLGLAMPAWAEDLEHIQQLMSTGQCSGCNLTRAGLVYGDFTGADLSGANLTQANLNQANLSGANLSGANLIGAVLYNANLTGADLRGADLRGADLRNTVMTGVILEGANLQGAVLVGAVGLPEDVATAEELYRWGLAEAQRGNFRGAAGYYSRAIELDADFAHAYLARGIARYRMVDEAGALEDGKQAEELYLAQGNGEGHQAAINFTSGVEAIQEANARGSGGGGGGFFNFLGSISGLVMRFLLR